MANLTAVIGADTSKFVEEIRSAKYMLDKFVADTKKASSTAKQNTTVTNEQVAAYQRVLKSLEKAGNGSLSTDKQTKVLESQVRELRIQWANLSDEARKGDFGKSLSATIQTANAQLKTLNTQLVQTQTNLQKGKNVNPFTNLQKGAANLTNTMSALGMAGGSTIATIGSMGATLANPYVLAGAAAAGATAAVVSYGKELEQQTNKTQKFLGITREEAAQTRASIKSISDVYGIDYNSALGMVDALMKQFGVDSKKATELVSLGMAGGANEAGHMADMIGKFSGIFSDAGLSAEQMIGLMSQTQSGIFSEQGMTVISKAGQRITQLSETVKQALNDIGINSDDMAKKLANGTMSTWDAIKTVSGALKKLPPDCQAFAVAAKEVFGKSGPEAGSKMLTMLSDMDISIQGVIDNMTDEEKATYNLQKASEELHSSMQSLFGTSSNGFATMTTDIKTKVIKVCTDLVNKFIDLYNQSTLFRGAIASLVATFKSIWSVLKGFIKGAMVGFEGLIVMVEDLLKLDFNKFGNDFNKFGNEFRKLDKQLSTEITKAWSEAVNKTLNGKINKIKVETTNTTKNKVQSPSTTTTTNKGRLSTDKKAVTDAKKNLEELKKLEKEFKAIELSPSVSSYDQANGINPYDTNTKEGVQKLMDFNDKLIDKLDDLRIKFEEVGGTGSSTYNQICSAILNTTNENVRLGESSTTMMDKATKEAKKKLEEEFNNIEFSPTLSSFEMAVGNVKFDTKTIEGIQLQMDFNDNLIKQLKQLQEGYEKAGLQGEESYDKVANKIKNVQDEQSKLSKDAKKKSKKTTKEKFDSGVQQYQTITEPLMGIDNVVGQFESLQKAIEDGASAWEVFIGVVQTVDSVLQAVSSTIEAVNTIQQLLGTTTQTTAAIQTEAAVQDSANTAIEVGNSQAKIAAKQGEAVANATSSGSKMPFPANLAAIAAGIAAVVAAFAMVGSFADGGIIKGASTLGDYNIARVNGGEMILNGSQQGNLWNAIKNNRLGGGGNVAIVGGDVRIKGSDLYVALKNYSKVQGKLGKTTGIL